MTVPDEPILKPSSTAANRFVVAGVSLTSLRKELKPALPKKRQEASYTVVITATATSVTFAITGASVKMPAVASGECVAELPYVQFKNILTEPYDAGALVVFELAPGSFTVNNITTKSPQIVVQQSGTTAEVAATVVSDTAADAEQTPLPAPDTVIADPADTPMGLPLLAAYKYIRTYGIRRLIANKVLVENQLEVDELLKRADWLLRPVGISRSDLELWLDQKVGHRSPCQQHDTITPNDVRD
jgi:hypothetical protein